MTTPRPSHVAALYDIHGNLPALDAVLAEVREANVDQVVVGGDVVLGPMPNETLARLLDLDVPVSFIRGNCDREIVAARSGAETPTLPAQVREVIRWVARELEPSHERELAAWPLTLSMEIQGLGTVMFCHATPRNDYEIFTRRTPDDRLTPVFEGVDAALVVCGHSHMQFERRVGRVRVTNAGSVGMPFGDPGADWLLLGPDVQLRHTTYDLTAAAERVRSTSYPQADDFAARHVLHPPSANEMLEAFAKVELR